jgi:hypothetical protein
MKDKGLETVARSAATAEKARELRAAKKGLHARKSPLQSINCEENALNISVSLGPLAALIAGILILVVPRLLNYIVAIYLVIVGILGLVGPASQHLRL